MTVPGSNWAYIKDMEAHTNQPFAMMKTGRILGYAHRECPSSDEDWEAI